MKRKDYNSLTLEELSFGIVNQGQVSALFSTDWSQLREFNPECQVDYESRALSVDCRGISLCQLCGKPEHVFILQNGLCPDCARFSILEDVWPEDWEGAEAYD